MAGRGSRFFEDGFVQPKPLIEIHGAPFFYWAARSIGKNIPLDGITFVVLKEHIRDFGLEARIRAYWPDARIVALDERGDNIDSTAFARHLGRWRDDQVANTIFAIGGADGLSPDLRRKAKLRLAFGAATWPHQIVRVMLLEQVYRAATILAGHPYHRA